MAQIYFTFTDTPVAYAAPVSVIAASPMLQGIVASTTGKFTMPLPLTLPHYWDWLMNSNKPFPTLGITSWTPQKSIDVLPITASNDLQTMQIEALKAKVAELTSRTAALAAQVDQNPLRLSHLSRPKSWGALGRGDLVYAKDCHQKWYWAAVKQVLKSERKVAVTFLGWDAHYDEIVPYDQSHLFISIDK